MILKRISGLTLILLLVISTMSLSNFVKTYADSLPSGTTSSFGPYPSSMTIQVIVVSNSGPQTQYFSNPSGPVSKVFTTVTTYVQGAVLYFDSGGVTYSVSVSPNSNALYTFPSPLNISNVRISIDNRGYPDDALHFGYELAPPSSTSSQAIGQTTILGTCGMTFPNSNSVNYGSLIPNTIGPEVRLNMTNTGTVPATLQVSGSNWLDGSSNPQMLANRTHYNVTSGTYSQKYHLELFNQILTSNFVPTIVLQTFWQLQAILMNPSFTGSTTQTMDFTVSC